MAASTPALPPLVREAVDDLKARLASRFGDRLVDLRVFGSFARGAAGPESDVDVLVVVDGLAPTARRDVFDITTDVRLDRMVRLAPLALSTDEWRSLQERELLLAADIERDGIALQRMRTGASTSKPSWPRAIGRGVPAAPLPFHRRPAPVYTRPPMFVPLPTRRLAGFAALLSLLAVRARAGAVELDVRGWLDEPGVKLVVVEFYAEWCGPCMEAIPRWEALRRRYRDDGLRLLVVNHRPETPGCPALVWIPDANVCDLRGEIGTSFGFGRLPAAYLWSWQGNLLVQQGHVEAVEAEVRRYLAQAPRVEVRARDARGRPNKALRRLFEAKVHEHGKLTVVADKEMRRRLKGVRRASHGLARRESQQCPLGEEVSANSVLEVEHLGDQLSVVLVDAASGCQRAGAFVPWSKEDKARSVAAAVHKLVRSLRHPLQMPSGGATLSDARPARAPAPLPPPVTPSGPQIGGGEIAPAVGRLRVEGQPRRARVDVDGPGGSRALSLPDTLEGLDPGDYRVRVSAQGYLTHEEVARVEADLTATVQVKLQRPGGLVVDGEPVGAAAELLDGSGRSLGRAGLPLTANGLPPGEYRVRVERQGYQTHEETTAVRAGETTTVRVVLERARAPAAPERLRATRGWAAGPPAPGGRWPRGTSLAEVVAASGAWIRQHGVRFGSERPAPPAFSGYFMNTTGNMSVNPGAIVKGARWDDTHAPFWHLVYGRSDIPNATHRKVMRVEDVTYLGPAWEPRFVEWSQEHWRRAGAGNASWEAWEFLDAR